MHVFSPDTSKKLRDCFIAILGVGEITTPVLQTSQKLDESYKQITKKIMLFSKCILERAWA